MRQTISKPRARIDELDFLKCVCIILMVMFHLVYVGDKWAEAKQVVYMFHMPVFLVISGYVANMSRSTKEMLRHLWWLFVPYAVMECGYVVMASLLPIREHIDQLTPLVLLEKLFVSPLGPYWYLHTLILCTAVAYAVGKMWSGFTYVAYCCVVGSVFLLVGLMGVVSINMAFFFLIGLMLRRTGTNFLAFFQPSWWAISPLLMLLFWLGGLTSFHAKGLLVVYLAISVMLAVYRLLCNASFCSQTTLSSLLFIGRNTLGILLFSPIFTVMCKPLVAPLSFDPTGVVFAVVATSVSVAGSFAIAWFMDFMGASRWFCGRNRMIM